MTLRVVLAAITLILAAPAKARMYKCQGADAKTAYQAEPRAAGARQSAVEVRESRGVSPGPGPLPVSEVARIVSLPRWLGKA